MSTVVVERTFVDPVAFEDVQAIEERGAWCLAAHGVRFLKTYFSRDRRRMICLYEAPDAESVRLAEEKAGVPFEAAWASRVISHSEPGTRGDAIVVERLLPQPFDEEGIREAVAAGAWCLQQYGCRILSTHLAGDGRRCVCVFEAPDTESVRQAQKRMGMPYVTAWPATVHEPPAE